METLLITGASSFTAPYIAHEAKKLNVKVVATSLSGKHVNKCFDKIVQCDITKQSDVVRTITDINPSKVIHLAGLSFVGHSNLEDFYRVNAIGTDIILNSLKKLNHKISSILISSSANVYGTPNVSKIDESLVPTPVNHYASSKLAMEHIVRTYQENLSIIIARPFNYVGHGQNPLFVVPKIVNAFANRQKSLELGNINVSRDFSSVYDIAKAYLQLINCNEAIGETFNVCSGYPTSLKFIISSLTEISGINVNITTNEAFIRKNEILSLTGSNEKLIKHINNWQPTQSLMPILTEMYEKQVQCQE